MRGRERSGSLPVTPRVTMLPACSSFPNQKPLRSVPHSSSKASCRPRSSCGACSPVSPTTCRRGMSRALSPLGSRCRHARPSGFGAGSPEAVPRDARRHPVTPHGGPDLDHRFPLTVSAGRAYPGIGGAGSASGSFDQSHVQSLPAKRLGDKSDYPHAIAPGFDVTSLPLRHVQSLPQTY